MTRIKIFYEDKTSEIIECENISAEIMALGMKKPIEYWKYYAPNKSQKIKPKKRVKTISAETVFAAADNAQLILGSLNKLKWFRQLSEEERRAAFMFLASFSGIKGKNKTQISQPNLEEVNRRL